MIESYGPQHQLAHVIVDELLLQGVRQFFISPGNQSSPLIAALTQREARGEAQLEFHFDERGAAFAALGYGRVLEKPAVVVTTSGSAVANLMPAAVEAYRDQIPLIFITADRPIELQDCGANQTLNQSDLLAASVRWQHVFPAPDSLLFSEAAAERRRAVRSAIDYGVYATMAQPAGPVQLTVEFRKPFFVSPAGSFDPASTPLTHYAHSQSVVAETELRRLAQLLCRAKRGLVVVGPLSPSADRRAIEECVRALQWPVYASVLSGLRRQSFSGFCASHWYLADKEVAEILRPDFVLQLGGELPKPGNAVLTAVEQSGAMRVLVSMQAGRVDPLHSTQQRVIADPSWFAAAITPHLKPAPSGLLAPWGIAEEIAAAQLDEIDTREAVSEIAITRRVFRALTAERQLVIANSLPVRIAEFCASRGAPEIFCNRGVSGIDGTIATAIGAAIAGAKPTVLLIGDLSFLYDLSSLPMAQRLRTPLIVVLLNNDGGAIFDQLPKPELPSRYAEILRAKHGLSAEHFAKAIGAFYAAPSTLSDFDNAFANALRATRVSILEVSTTAEAVTADFVQLREEIGATVAKNLRN